MTKLMGILNITPDSFYENSRSPTFEEAIARAERMIQEGADILDVGAESTRPGAIPVSEEEELRRIIPVINKLHQLSNIQISVDTMKPKVAAAAVDAGASLINDVSGFRNPLMREIALSSQAELCLMHMKGTPDVMQQNPIYEEGIINHLLHWFDIQINLLLSMGIKEKKIILDPGIGFGKTIADNLEIIHNLPKIKDLGFPVLLGISRKSFMGKLISKPPAELLPATLAINSLAVAAGVDVIRVHDVNEHRSLIDIVNMFQNYSS